MDVMTGELWIVRHGETAWSRDGRHTSVTDVPLTAEGERAARGLAPRLAGTVFDRALTSPRIRSRRTADLAGFPDAEVDEDLVEWDYGDYEGLTTPEIRVGSPGWTIWGGSCPGGESAEQVGARLDRVVAALRDRPGRTLVFGHGHALRVLAGRWLGLPVAEGRLFRLDTATLSVLGYERETAAMLRWNG